MIIVSRPSCKVFLYHAYARINAIHGLIVFFFYLWGLFSHRARPNSCPRFKNQHVNEGFHSCHHHHQSPTCSNPLAWRWGSSRETPIYQTQINEPPSARTWARALAKCPVARWMSTWRHLLRGARKREEVAAGGARYRSRESTAIAPEMRYSGRRKRARINASRNRASDGTEMLRWLLPSCKMRTRHAERAVGERWPNTCSCH